MGKGEAGGALITKLAHLIAISVWAGVRDNIMSYKTFI